MAHRIEVALKSNLTDPAGHSLRNQLKEDLALEVGGVRTVDIYTIDMDLDPQELDKICTELCTDSVIHNSCVDKSLAGNYAFLIEVGFLPGVTDNVGKSAMQGVEDVLGRKLKPGEAVYKSTQYLFGSEVDTETCEHIARDQLANELIQRWVLKSAEEMDLLDGEILLGLPIVTDLSDPEVHAIDLNIQDDELVQLSRDKMLALELDELKAIQDYYANDGVAARRAELGLPEQPTDIELEILAQTWSEHCKHKIFSAEIEYTDEDGQTRTIDSLFNTFVKATTEEVAKKIDWLISVFHDNAGIVRFDEDWSFALKAETHNSPSALDPYGGAITGIVGVNRDIIGAGMGSQCIFNTDVFCFASPFHDGEIPARLFHPKRVFRGVHQGVVDGGNQSGIPDLNGAIVFHERFLGKPLVFVGTGGLIPAKVGGRPSHEKKANPGDLIVMTGGRIGKDGIHGATFSSEELHEGSPATAVQIGDPITQKKMGDFLFEARDLGLFTCITDNGAGGLSSSVGEMASGAGGCQIHLDKAPLKYAGLAPWEIFLSEAQERMTLAVPPGKVGEFMDLAKRRDVEATELGVFTDSGYLECFYDGKLIASLDMDFMHDGVPKMKLKAVLSPVKTEPEVIVEGADLAEELKNVLATPNTCSKESFVRMYDHEVLGQSVLKQFQGVDQDGPGDAGVIRPVPGSDKGIGVACGICPKYSDLDTYQMMANAVDEAIRNLVCVGAKIGTIAGLDNFCWPDPVQSEKTPDGEHKLAQLVRCCQALYDACVAYDVPLISGKDSMKNDYKIGDTRISIPPTVLFTAAAVLDNVNKVVSMDVKKPGDNVYVLGDTANEMGGSEYMAMREQLGANVPKVDFKKNRALYEKLSGAIEAGLVESCHDCSDGGLGAALAESSFAGGYGMDLDISPLNMKSNIVALFSESAGRFVVTVDQENVAVFESQLDGSSITRLGSVISQDRFKLKGSGNAEIDVSIAELKEAWQKPLKW